MKNLIVVLGPSLVAIAAFTFTVPAHAAPAGECLAVGSLRTNGLHLNALTYNGFERQGLTALPRAGAFGLPSSNRQGSGLQALAQTALLKKAELHAGGLLVRAAHPSR